MRRVEVVTPVHGDALLRMTRPERWITEADRRELDPTLVGQGDDVEWRRAHVGVDNGFY